MKVPVAPKKDMFGWARRFCVIFALTFQNKALNIPYVWTASKKDTASFVTYRGMGRLPDVM